MPFISSVRGSYGAQGRFGRSAAPTLFVPSSGSMTFSSATYSALNTSTLSSVISGVPDTNFMILQFAMNGASGAPGTYDTLAGGTGAAGGAGTFKIKMLISEIKASYFIVGMQGKNWFNDGSGSDGATGGSTAGGTWYNRNTSPYKPVLTEGNGGSGSSPSGGGAGGNGGGFTGLFNSSTISQGTAIAIVGGGGGGAGSDDSITPGAGGSGGGFNQSGNAGGNPSDGVAGGGAGGTISGGGASGSGSNSLVTASNSSGSALAGGNGGQAGPTAATSTSIGGAGGGGGGYFGGGGGSDPAGGNGSAGGGGGGSGYFNAARVSSNEANIISTSVGGAGNQKTIEATTDLVRWGNNGSMQISWGFSTV